jgi:hypothetical protein
MLNVKSAMVTQKVEYARAAPGAQAKPCVQATPGA